MRTYTYLPYTHTHTLSHPLTHAHALYLYIYMCVCVCVICVYHTAHLHYTRLVCSECMYSVHQVITIVLHHRSLTKPENPPSFNPLVSQVLPAEWRPGQSPPWNTLDSISSLPPPFKKRPHCGDPCNKMGDGGGNKGKTQLLNRDNLIEPYHRTRSAATSKHRRGNSAASYTIFIMLHKALVHAEYNQSDML
ncbi:hypothetical protein F4810DRAFT_662852 [Camillea tinctor]|nr:hypothetical protein F4810DRAFT_662852 [Camillea tinctor]